MVAVKLSGWEDIDTFADCQYMINKPLCIVCDDADILESALRVYQGRALYEGALSEEELLPLCDKYGLIICFFHAISSSLPSSSERLR